MSRGFCIIFAMSRNSNLREWRHLSAGGGLDLLVGMRADIMSHVTVTMSHRTTFYSTLDTVQRNECICWLPTLEYWNRPHSRPSVSGLGVYNMSWWYSQDVTPDLILRAVKFSLQISHKVGSNLHLRCFSKFLSCQVPRAGVDWVLVSRHH